MSATFLQAWINGSNYVSSILKFLERLRGVVIMFFLSFVEDDMWGCGARLVSQCTVWSMGHVWFGRLRHIFVLIRQLCWIGKYFRPVGIIKNAWIWPIRVVSLADCRWIVRAVRHRRVIRTATSFKVSVKASIVDICIVCMLYGVVYSSGVQPCEV